MGNLKMYEINKLHHGKGTYTAFSHLLVCIRNLTGSLCALFRFLMHHQLVRKCRTRALPIN